LASPSASHSLPSWHDKPILLFCLTNFFFWLCLYLYVPILPIYAQSLGASLSMVGAIVASYSIPQILLRIPIGVLFDTINKRKLLLAGGIFMALVGALGLGLAPSPWFLFIARTVTGIGAACWVIFATYFTAYYPTEGTQKAIGMINFVQGTSVVVATFGGGLIAEARGLTYPFWGAAVMGLLSLVTLLLAKPAVFFRGETVSWNRFTVVASRPLLIMASLLGILAQFANWAGLFSFIPIYGAQIGASKADLGIITMISLAFSAMASLAVVSLTRRWGISFTILLGSVLLGFAIVIVPFIQEVSLLKVVMVVNGLGRGLLSTIFMSLSVQAVAPQHRATAMGVYQATYSLGMLLGPMVSGFLADNVGLSAVFYLSAAICGVMAGLAYLPILPRLSR